MEDMSRAIRSFQLICKKLSRASRRCMARLPMQRCAKVSAPGGRVEGQIIAGARRTRSPAGRWERSVKRRRFCLETKAQTDQRISLRQLRPGGEDKTLHLQCRLEPGNSGVGLDMRLMKICVDQMPQGTRRNPAITQEMNKARVPSLALARFL